MWRPGRYRPSARRCRWSTSACAPLSTSLPLCTLTRSRPPAAWPISERTSGRRLGPGGDTPGGDHGGGIGAGAGVPGAYDAGYMPWAASVVGSVHGTG